MTEQIRACKTLKWDFSSIQTPTLSPFNSRCKASLRPVPVLMFISQHAYTHTHKYAGMHRYT